MVHAPSPVLVVVELASFDGGFCARVARRPTLLRKGDFPGESSSPPHFLVKRC